MYLHDFGEEAASFTKEEMSQGKHLEYESKLIETILHIPKNMQNIVPTSSGANAIEPEADSPPDTAPTEHKKNRSKTNGHRTTRSLKNPVSEPAHSNDTKLNQPSSSSVTSLTVNTNTDHISSTSINNMNTQTSSSSSSSSSSSLTPSQQNHLSQQVSPVQQNADTNNNIDTVDDLDLNSKLEFFLFLIIFNLFF